MQLKIYHSFNKELESIWIEFEKTAIGTPFQCYHWLSHWQATVGKPLYSVEPYIITVKNNEQVLAILPLGIRRSMGISIPEWIGGINADYMGFLFHSEWIWKSNRTDLQTIGSYTRTCRCVIDPNRQSEQERLDILWRWIVRYS